MATGTDRMGQPVTELWNGRARAPVECQWPVVLKVMVWGSLGGEELFSGDRAGFG